MENVCVTQRHMWSSLLDTAIVRDSGRLLRTVSKCSPLIIRAFTFRIMTVQPPLGMPTMRSSIRVDRVFIIITQFRARASCAARFPRAFHTRANNRVTIRLEFVVKITSYVKT